MGFALGVFFRLDVSSLHCCSEPCGNTPDASRLRPKPIDHRMEVVAFDVTRCAAGDPTLPGLPGCATCSKSFWAKHTT